MKGVRVSMRSLGWQIDESLSSALGAYLTKEVEKGISMVFICETTEHTGSVSGFEGFAYVVYRDIP
jgi:hypothetical protein